MRPVAELAAEVLHQALDAGLSPSEPVVVAVSGGADSVALLRLLGELPRPLAPRRIVAHYHHGLRGGAADADASFVQRLAQALSVECRIGYWSGVRPAGVSLEMAARLNRHAFLREVAADVGARLIAVGHHRDDQAETVLLRLLRGTGTDGLAAMRPLTDRGLWRPLLFLEREDLRDYLAAIGQPFREDASNADRSFERNRVRHEVFPLLESVRPGAVRHLAETAEAASDARSLSAIALDVRLPVKRVDGPGGPWCEAPGAVWLASELPLRRAWLRAAAKVLGHPWPAADWVRGWATAPSAMARPVRPELLVAWQGEVRGLVVADGGGHSGGTVTPLSGEVTWCDGGTVSVGFIPPRLGTRWVGGAVGQPPFVLRPWRPGDRLRRGDRQVKVSDMLRRVGVPVICRPRVPVVEDANGEVVWFPGAPKASTARSSSKTIWFAWMRPEESGRDCAW